MAQNFSELANFVWSVADLLRGDYKQADYGKVILPFTLLRRLDCVLEGTKEEVLREHAKNKSDGPALDRVLKRKSKQAFYNTSPFSISWATMGLEPRTTGRPRSAAGVPPGFFTPLAGCTLAARFARGLARRSCSQWDGTPC